MAMKDKIIVALDVPNAASAMDIVDELGDSVGAYKVGMELYNATGPSIIQEITARKGKVFLDLKFHDIPNTVAGAARVAANLGAFMFNVHASGGRRMMTAAAEALQEAAANNDTVRPLLIGVTVLTSMSEEEMQSELDVHRTVGEQVTALSKLARESGLDGVVCSPLEIEMIRASCGPDFLIVTPGIRPRSADADDQKRIMTPGEAVRAGADYLVIGRPITKAENRREAVASIVKDMEGLS